MTISRSFNLGKPIAENDTLLKEVFVTTEIYQMIVDKTDQNCFIVGRTGSGKSALFEKLEEDWPDQVVRINPAQLAIPHVLNLKDFRSANPGQNFQRFWSVLWEHVIVTKILQHRISNKYARKNFLRSIIEQFDSDNKHQSFVDYVDRFESIFWADGKTQVEEIIKSQAGGGNVEASLGHKGIGVKANAEDSYSIEEKSVHSGGYSPLINIDLLKQLDDVIEVLNDEILDKHNFTYVVIDDLDKDWIDEDFYLQLIFALIDVAREFLPKENIKVLIALRTDIWERIDFSKLAKKQEEKYQFVSLNLNWTSLELENILDKRVNLVSQKLNLSMQTTLDLLPHPDAIKGDPLKYIFDRTLYRPRDAIDFMNTGLEIAIGKDALSWDDLKIAEIKYSERRLGSIRDEWATNYPGLDKVCEKFKKQKAYLSKTELQAILLECAYLQVYTTPDNNWKWLSSVTREAFQAHPSWYEACYPLLCILYEIGFIGIAKEIDGEITYILDNDYLINREDTFDEYVYFGVHPMFHKALNINS